VDDAPGVDAENVAVMSEVMDCARRQSVDHGSDAGWIGVRHDVRSLDTQARALHARR